MKALAILFLFFWTSDVALAQTPVADSAMLTQAMHHQRKQYHAAVNANSPLYNGTEYREPLYNSKNDAIPYFLSDDWIEGTLVYGGQFFEHVDLQYNIVE